MKNQRESFESYYEKTLPEGELQRFESALQSDAALRAEYDSYRLIRSTERSLAKTPYATNENLTARIMDAIEAPPPSTLARLVESFRTHRWQSLSGLATCAVLLIGIRVSLEHADEEIMSRPATSAVEQEVREEAPAAPKAAHEAPPPVKVEASQTTPVNAITAQIPAGHRAVTINVDQTMGIEGFARPGASVDIATVTKQDGTPKVMAVQKDARILFTERDPRTGTTTVTILASEQEAQKLALAQQTGSLALNLRGSSDAAEPARRQAESSITMNDLMGGATASQAGSVNGRVQMRGPDGATQEYDVLSDGSMRRRDPNAAETRVGPSAAGARGNTVYTTTIEVAEPAVAAALGVDGSSHNRAAPPGMQSNERYQLTEENRRQETAASPVSTFSIDVDTGSYTNIRRMLQQRVVVPSAAVRIEEMLNYFNYDYPEQYSQPFASYYEIAPSPLESGKHLLKLGIRARDVRDSDKPWNLTFLIDVSGSMNAANRLELVKQALKLLVERMRPQDRIAIVTYAGWTGVALPPTAGANRDQILRTLEVLQSGGSTNGAGGIQKAYELARQSFIQGGVNRVILATDGDFNVGVTNQQELITMIEQERKNGVTLTTIGVGEGNINESLMEQLANKGNGNYFYLDSYQEARKVFERQLMGTIEVVAKDVKLQVEFNPATVKEYRLIGYDNRRLENADFNNDAVDAGEIGSGHTVTALYEVTLVGSPSDQSLRYQPTPKPIEGNLNEIGFLKIRYKEPEGSESKLIETPLLTSTIKRSAEQASTDFRFAAAVSYFGHLLRRSQYVGSYTFAQIADLAARNLGSDEAGYRKEFVRLVQAAAAGTPAAVMPIAPGLPMR